MSGHLALYKTPLTQSSSVSHTALVSTSEGPASQPLRFMDSGQDPVKGGHGLSVWYVKSEIQLWSSAFLTSFTSVCFHMLMTLHVGF